MRLVTYECMRVDYETLSHSLQTLHY